MSLTYKDLASDNIKFIPITLPTTKPTILKYLEEAAKEKYTFKDILSGKGIYLKDSFPKCNLLDPNVKGKRISSILAYALYLYVLKVNEPTKINDVLGLMLGLNCGPVATIPFDEIFMTGNVWITQFMDKPVDVSVITQGVDLTIEELTGEDFNLDPVALSPNLAYLNLLKSATVILLHICSKVSYPYLLRLPLPALSDKWNALFNDFIKYSTGMGTGLTLNVVKLINVLKKLKGVSSTRPLFQKIINYYKSIDPCMNHAIHYYYADLPFSEIETIIQCWRDMIKNYAKLNYRFIPIQDFRSIISILKMRNQTISYPFYSGEIDDEETFARKYQSLQAKPISVVDGRTIQEIQRWSSGSSPFSVVKPEDHEVDKIKLNSFYFTVGTKSAYLPKSSLIGTSYVVSIDFRQLTCDLVYGYAGVKNVEIQFGERRLTISDPIKGFPIMVGVYRGYTQNTFVVRMYQKEKQTFSKVINDIDYTLTLRVDNVADASDELHLIDGLALLEKGSASFTFENLQAGDFYVEDYEYALLSQWEVHEVGFYRNDVEYDEDDDLKIKPVYRLEDTVTVHTGGGTTARVEYKTLIENDPVFHSTTYDHIIEYAKSGSKTLNAFITKLVNSPIFKLDERFLSDLYGAKTSLQMRYIVVEGVSIPVPITTQFDQNYLCTASKAEFSQALKDYTNDVNYNPTANLPNMYLPFVPKVVLKLITFVSADSTITPIDTNKLLPMSVSAEITTKSLLVYVTSTIRECGVQLGLRILAQMFSRSKIDNSRLTLTYVGGNNTDSIDFLNNFLIFLAKSPMDQLRDAYGGTVTVGSLLSYYPQIQFEVNGTIQTLTGSLSGYQFVSFSSNAPLPVLNSADSNYDVISKLSSYFDLISTDTSNTNLSSGRFIFSFQMYLEKLKRTI